MKFQMLVLFLLLAALLGSAGAADGLFLYIECSPGPSCIDLAYESGRTESVRATPAQVIAKSDIRSAAVQAGPGAAQSLNIELSREASDKLAQVTRENAGKKLVVALGNRVLIAPEIREPITDGRITVFSENGRFWEETPWLQDLIRESYRGGRNSVKRYFAITAICLIAAFSFIFFPRIRWATQRGAK